MNTGADPGFPIGGDADPPGVPTYEFCQLFFFENSIKLRNFWAVCVCGGGGGVCEGIPCAPSKAGNKIGAFQPSPLFGTLRT